MKKRIALQRKPVNPPNEYVILVGGPTNTFNGYMYVDINGDLKSPIPPENDSESEVLKYIRGDGLTDIPLIPPEKPGNPPKPGRPYTHDRYWANFLYAAVKLVECHHIRPQSGDIVTFIVYYPPYEMREKVDFVASPYNPRHQSKRWVANQFPYDRRWLGVEKGANTPPPPPNLPLNRTSRQIHAATSFTVEADINLEILIRTMSDVEVPKEEPPPYLPRFDGGYPIYHLQNVRYLDLLRDVPVRLGGGVKWCHGLAKPNPGFTPLQNTLIKLLLLTDTDPQLSIPQLFTYIDSGIWTGGYMRNVFQLRDEEDMNRGAPPDFNWTSWPPYPFRQTDLSTLWHGSPSVERTKIKIKEFHYVGHAGTDGFYLQYGWKNPKGTLPEPDVLIDDKLIDAALKGGANPFAADARAHLWGCEQWGNVTTVLNKYIRSVTACADTVDYEPVIYNYCSMPSPYGAWQTISR